jgi:hypothetical protein
MIMVSGPIVKPFDGITRAILPQPEGVAQVFNLLYRRFLTCTRSEPLPATRSL